MYEQPAEWKHHRLKWHQESVDHDLCFMSADLRDAVLRSHVGVLEKTIANARNSQFEGRLHKQIEAAERKLADLKVYRLQRL